MHHGVARPHDFDALVHLFAECAQIALLVVGPGSVVLSGAHDERRHVLVCGNEVVVDVVEQGCLLVGFRALAPDVVEEDGEGADAKGIHFLELGHECVAVGIVPFDVDAGMDGPVEFHTPLLGVLVEFLNAFGFVLGIRHAPVVAVVGVVLGSVDVDVHLVASVELDLAEASLVAPWRAVKALDRAAEGHVGPVGHRGFLQFALGQRLLQGLQTIEEAHLVATHHHGTLLGELQVVAFGVLGCFGRIFLDGFVAFHAQCEGEGCGGLAGNGTVLLQVFHCK